MYISDHHHNPASLEVRANPIVLPLALPIGNPYSITNTRIYQDFTSTSVLFISSDSFLRGNGKLS